MDWIDELKKRDAESSSVAQFADKVWMHRAQVIAAKLPMFWTALVEWVELDCNRLRAELNAARHCSIEKRAHNGFRINSERPSLPRFGLLVECNTTGATLDCHEFITTDIYHAEESYGHGQIRVALNENSDLIFDYKNKKYATPEKLAEALIRHVIEQ